MCGCVYFVLLVTKSLEVTSRLLNVYMTTADVRLRTFVLLLHGRILQDHECLLQKHAVNNDMKMDQLQTWYITGRVARADQRDNCHGFAWSRCAARQERSAQLQRPSNGEAVAYRPVKNECTGPEAGGRDA